MIRLILHQFADRLHVGFQSHPGRDCFYSHKIDQNSAPHAKCQIECRILTKIWVMGVARCCRILHRWFFSKKVYRFTRMTLTWQSLRATAPGWCCRCRCCSAASETDLATVNAPNQGSREVTGVLQKQDGNEASQLMIIINPIHLIYQTQPKWPRIYPLPNYGFCRVFTIGGMFFSPIKCGNYLLKAV